MVVVWKTKAHFIKQNKLVCPEYGVVDSLSTSMWLCRRTRIQIFSSLSSLSYSMGETWILKSDNVHLSSKMDTFSHKVSLQ